MIPKYHKNNYDNCQYKLHINHWTIFLKHMNVFFLEYHKDINKPLFWPLFSSYLVPISHCFYGKIWMRKDQIHLLGFNCAYNVICLYFQEESSDLDSKDDFGNELQGDWGLMKPREPKEDG